MLKLPTSFTPKLQDYLRSVKLPSVCEITQTFVNEVADDLKNLKKLITAIKAEKKEAEEPFELERKKAQGILDEAKANKIKAGEQYIDVLDSLSTLEGNLRTLVIKFQEAEQEKVRKAAEEAAKKRAEEERLRAEAEAAAEKARRSGNNRDAVKAVQAETKAKAAAIEVANVVIPQAVRPTGTAVAHRISFEVEDILKVPIHYVEYAPNLELIEKTIRTQFPFLTELSFKLDLDQIPDGMMHDIVIAEDVLKDLRAGKVIPGIKKTTTEHLVVR